MTLDEAIIHAREVAKNKRREATYNFPTWGEYYDECRKCANEHEQLAIWLEDLKRRRKYDGELTGSGALNNAYKSGYEKAIKDFIVKYKFCDNRSIQCNKALNCADCIADQLKEGITNDW